MESAVGHVVWFDIHVGDSERAQHFYARVFGWQFRPLDSYAYPYWLIQAPDGKPIGGMRIRQNDPAAENAAVTTVLYVEVAGLSDALRLAEEAGATIVVPPTPIPNDPDAYAVLKDTEGNMIGIIAPVATPAAAPV